MKLVKPPGQFYDGKPCIYGHGTMRYSAGGACVVCSRQKSKERYASGRKKKSKYDPVYRRERNLLANYGLTIEQYDALSEAQGHVCAICGGIGEGHMSRRLVVDHCHRSGKMRALLCGKCNVGLGSFDDNPTKLRQAIEYLAGGTRRG